MLAQAAIVARLANFLTRRDDQQFVVHAIYITENYEAEWYLVYADPNDVRNSTSVSYVQFCIYFLPPRIIRINRWFI